MVLFYERCVVFQCGRKLQICGLRVGDLITHINGVAVATSDDFRNLICGIADQASQEASRRLLSLTIWRLKPEYCGGVSTERQSRRPCRSMNSSGTAGLAGRRLHDLNQHDLEYMLGLLQPVSVSSR